LKRTVQHMTSEEEEKDIVEAHEPKKKKVDTLGRWQY